MVKAGLKLKVEAKPTKKTNRKQRSQKITKYQRKIIEKM